MAAMSEPSANETEKPVEAETGATTEATTEAKVEATTEAKLEAKAGADVNVEVAHCANCGAALLGDYCSDCGQEDRIVRRPFWRIIRQMLHAVFELDGRVYRSLFFLYTRPGHLSTEYLNGRRARYTPPLRMFLVLSISFFLIVSIAGTFSEIFGDAAGLGPLAAGEELDREAPLRPGQQIREALGDDATENGLADLDFDPQEMRAALEGVEIPFLPAATGARLKDFLVEQTASNYVEARDNPGAFFRDFFGESLEYVTVFILLMMPMLALVLWALFIFKGRYYVEHFILTLHNHSFLMVSVYLWTITGIITGLLPALAGFIEWIDFAIFMWILIYLYLSLKNFYGSGYVVSGLVYVTASLIYGALLMAGLAVFLAIAFLLY